MKKKLTLENILLFFIAILPILDFSSFLFRNYFKTNLSVSTFLRPIIPAIIIVVIFFKNKFKLKTIIISIIYLIYSIIHLYIFTILKTEASYGTIIHEAQYLMNYTFAILNLFIFLFIFNKKNTNKIARSVLIANGIYILSIYISIITKTSSSTYIEGIGFKGWFESGNSISSILILNLFIIFTLFNKLENKKIKIIAIIETVLSGIYLCFLLGTRTGLFGFALVVGLFAFSKIVILLRDTLINKSNSSLSVRKKIILIISSFLIIFIVALVIFKGNSLLKRRKYLQSIENDIYDNSTGQTSHISGDILKLKEQIELGEMSEKVLSIPAQKSIISLYNYANKHNISNTDRRTQQLVYNTYLVKNQSNIIYLLFGNGFLANFRELILEMEIPAFLFNFGIIGLIIYFIPFLALSIYYIYIGIKNIKKIDDQFILLLSGIIMSFALSLLLGRLFFNSSAMIIITAMNVLLYEKCNNFKNNIMEEK